MYIYMYVESGSFQGRWLYHKVLKDFPEQASQQHWDGFPTIEVAEDEPSKFSQT